MRLRYWRDRRNSTAKRQHPLSSKSTVRHNHFLLAREIYFNRRLIQRQLRIRFPMRFWRTLGRGGKPCLRQDRASPQSLPGQPGVAESGNLGAIHGNAGPPDCFRAHWLLGQELKSLCDYIFCYVEFRSFTSDGPRSIRLTRRFSGRWADSAWLGPSNSGSSL